MRVKMKVASNSRHQHADDGARRDTSLCRHKAESLVEVRRVEDDRKKVIDSRR